MDFVEADLVFSPLVPYRGIFTALLAEQGFESFLDTPKCLKAYIAEDSFVQEEVLGIMETIDIPIEFRFHIIEHQNWNEIWEEDYHPVFIGSEVVIRAPFHESFDSYSHVITIQPEMSFGTGHHPTTELMVEHMLELDFKGSDVLDLGTGTGVLAIFSEQLGAQSILAVEQDAHVVDNARENVLQNQCVNIDVEKGSAQDTWGGKHDYILANINVNALIGSMEAIASEVRPGGQVLMSGFYVDDVPALKEEAERHGLCFQEVKNRNRWAAIRFMFPLPS